MPWPVRMLLATFGLVAACSGFSAEKQASNQEFEGAHSSVKQSGILDEKEARVLAAALANDEFSRKKITARIYPESWSIARKSKGRWEFVKVAPAGSQAWVSFELNGEKPDVKVEYALE